MTAASGRARASERLRSHNRRQSNRAETNLRLRAVALVALMLAGILIAGRAVHADISPAATLLTSGQLPVVNLASSASVEWECPGPLPAGTSPYRSSVIIANPGQRPATVVVDVAARRVASKHLAGRPLPSWSTQLTVTPRSQQVVVLRTTGPKQNDAVSVLSTSGSVGVFESVATAPSARVRHKGQTAGETSLGTPEQSPCATGVTGSSYLASGSTAGRSDVVVSLFNPTATQAVAAIRVSTGSAVVVPPALQGIIIKPYSLQVFQLARWVVQQATVAVTETTSVGRVAMGASESIESDSTAATVVSGQALLIGVATPNDAWVMTSGLGQPLRTVSVRVYDPGSRAASVTIFCPVVGKPLTEITAVVPAGEVRAVTLPLPTASNTSRGKAPPPLVAGPIVVRTAEGVGVVVARIVVRQDTPRSQTVSVVAATANPADDWLVPAGSGTSVAVATSVAGSLVVSNAVSAPADLEVDQLAAAGQSNAATLTTLTVAAGGTGTVKLQLAGTSFAVLEVRASSPVVIEQDYSPASASDTAPVGPTPVEGIPVIG
ncbi:MAG: hypothetical protein ABSB54_12520 [Acidimicrobiales bacterium]|jgi:hypothetical protein